MPHALPDIQPTDPADTLLVQAHFYNERFWHLDRVYTTRGTTYAITVPRRQDPLAPVDGVIWKYGGVEEVDVIRQDVGAVATQRVVLTEVARINGMSGNVEWYDESERHEL